MVDHRARLIAAALCVLLGLGGCALPAKRPAPFVADRPVNPPAGWVDYCRQAPADSSCINFRGKP